MPNKQPEMDRKPNHDKFLIFMHIPKTAGTTLGDEIMVKQYPRFAWIPHTKIDDNLYWPIKDYIGTLKDRIQRADSLQGHVCYGIHRFLAPSRPFTYITMLRDPIERVISLYFYVLKSPRNRMHSKVKNMSLDNFIESDEFKSETSNLQTRFACGGGTPDLEKAIENLDNSFSVVGITELFDESIFLMKRNLRWKNIRYQRANVNRNRPSKRQVSQNIKDKIRINNELDLKLYHYFREKLQKEIQSLDPQTKHELDVFKESHFLR